jgi:multicomponent Na+:H+ antiporter subunit G
MMAVVADVITWICILAGGFCGLVSGIGMVRGLPDLFSRMHAAGISDTLAAGLILIGLTFQAGFTIVTIKLLMILVLILFTSPTSTHALAKAALHGGLKPVVTTRETRSS